MDKQFRVERDMLIYAMRYALGRMTFAPSTVIENIKCNINLFNNDELKMLIRDIEDQAGFGYGMECDTQTWLSFREYLENRINSTTVEKIIPRV